MIKYKYNSEGLREVKVGEREVRYLLDGLAVLCEYDVEGIKREYVPGVSMKTNNQTYYYITDRLGSVRYVLDSSGSVVNSYSYTPFGQIHSFSGSLSQPYQFVGGEFYYKEEEIGLYLLGQRWYDAEVGRFISRDLIFDLNFYWYTRNSPLNYIDPWGLICFIIMGYSTPWRDIDLSEVIGVVYQQLPDTVTCILLEGLLGIPCKPGMIGTRIRMFVNQEQERYRKYKYLCIERCPVRIYTYWSDWQREVRKILQQWTRYAFKFDREPPIFTEWHKENLWEVK